MPVGMRRGERQTEIRDAPEDPERAHPDQITENTANLARGWAMRWVRFFLTVRPSCG